MSKKVKKPGRWKKILIIVIIIIALALVAVSFFGGNYLVNYSIGRSGDGANREVALEVEVPSEGIEKVIAEGRNAQTKANEEFLEEVTPEEVNITSDDGLNLKGFVYTQEDDTHDWAIAIHGYRGSHKGAVGMAQHYYDEDYNVLTPDLRACGESEGDYVGMGWLDRKDILNWIDWIIEEDPEAEIVIHGISMGAATTMMTSGEETPDQVKVFIEDCGYTTVYDIFASELKLRFGMPEFPLMYTASFIANMKAGYSFSEASSLDQVAKCEKPMLFIHGTADDFIPYEMMDEIYQVKPGTNKKEITAEGAGHGEAMYVLGDEYWDDVFEFIEEYTD